MKYFIETLKGLTVATALCIAFSGYAKADAFIDVPHFQQLTPVWCWVAAAQQVIAYKKGFLNTPQQCALVEATDGASLGMCCNFGHPGCVHTGNFTQVANLISYFGGSYSTYVLPANAFIIESTLQAGKPILAQIATGGSSTHVVVIRGIKMTPTPILLINDPMAPVPYEVPFINLASIWIDGIVIN
ncbi:papain-like cysteine protease family protein [Pseudomonas brassicacearum]|uniref:papain-like cysteine protease family protein n=1 Tax=Pseudomonas brassicacearum TaxID=930166 RepID=UPI0009BE0481|nr:papain-like cysteine protease family protein [Pseudomonas brassicacearum]